MPKTENQVKIFENSDFGKLPVIVVNDKPQFGATESAEMLGYAKPLNAIAQHCKEDGSSFQGVIDSLGRTQKKKFISEGNLYRLITHSHLPAAEKFESWVFDEVLPAIRKTGSYATKKDDPDLSTIRAKEADAKLMNARARLGRQYHKMLSEYNDVLSPIAKQALISLEVNTLAGKDLLPEPNSEPKGYSAEDLGKLVGWSKQKVGKFANDNDLKKEENGKWLMSKSQYGPKQVTTFVYNENGRQKFLELVRG
ncbi:toxin Bro [Sporolactobacillus shoreae]|uniref:Toxin Bro n=1 Tax=Sporolactobacillus shoreae TaxID=1465501 RepID=A0A4Z0GK36_9BACL|nr:BRO family protein [Sporolactobacillus shoreae]TGA96716.1 toxin Bro [Sporolactobacillus shoreae]